MRGDREHLVEVLSEHVPNGVDGVPGTGGVWVFCTCGERLPVHVEDYPFEAVAQDAAWAEHRADVLMPVLTGMCVRTVRRVGAVLGMAAASEEILERLLGEMVGETGENRENVTDETEGETDGSTAG